MTSSLCYPKYLFFFLLALLSISLGSCSTSSQTPQEVSFAGSWQAPSLEGTFVNSFNKLDKQLYANTDNGVYTQELSGNIWTPLGLQDEKVLNIVFLQENKLLAAIRISDFTEGIPSLFLTSNNGQSWQPWMNNYGGDNEEYTWVADITSLHPMSDTLFTRNSGTTVIRSVNGGKSWEVVNGDWNLSGGSAVLIYSDPFHAGRIWAGGVNAFSMPYLLKSSDYGETWKELNILENIEAVCWDIAVHPKDKKKILAGLSGGFTQALQIRKSTDGGSTWTTVRDSLGVFTLAQSPKDGKIIYASGKNQQGTLFFAASGDFGDTWQTVEFEDSPTGIQVKDMVSVIADGQEVLYLGTNKGVYSYVFEE